MTRNCITGANGFIGKHLAEKLTGTGGSIRFIPHHQICRTFAFDFDRVFFLSTYGNMASHTEHQMIIEANVRNLLWALMGFNNGWFCYMSSSSVTLPVQTPYSRTKRAAEEILQALPELKSCIVRPYSVVGRGEQKEHLIPTLIRSCMEGEVMPFDPYPVHDFVDVSDICDALIDLSEKKTTGIVELGNGYPYTNQEVLELVQLVIGKKANVQIRTSLRSYDNAEWYCKTPYFHKYKSLLQSIEEMVAAYPNERA